VKKWVAVCSTSANGPVAQAERAEVAEQLAHVDAAGGVGDQRDAVGAHVELVALGARAEVLAE